MAATFTPGSPAWLRWVQVFEEAKGCPFKASLLSGVGYGNVMRWRARIYGPTWKRCAPGRFRLTEPQISELAAAMAARIPLRVMAPRFGVSRRTLINLVKRYGLPRIRAPRQASKTL